MSDANNRHTISLTKEQYLSLLKTVYLGNWVANGNRDGTETNKRLEEFETVENIILSHAKQFGYDRYVDDELAAEGTYFPTRAFESETDVEQLLDEYTEDIFLDQLVERLADRDLNKHYSDEQIRAMTQEERMDKLYKHIDKWAEEINANGLDNIGIESPF